jgi:DNA (cytosine-5)-methyltransferase 1
MWPHIYKIIRDIEVPIVFLENVPGIVHNGLETVGRDLGRLGYCVEAGFFSAAEVGASHKRQRIFILAHRKEQPKRKSWNKRLWSQGWESPERSGRTDVADVGCVGADRKQSGWSGRPCWPYPPDFGGTWPVGLEPAIRRVAYGTSNRMDRLRAIGNGVVPLVAAYAFKTLMRRAVRGA